MNNEIQITFGMLAFLLLFFPASLLAYAAFRVSKVAASVSVKLIAVGAFLLTITSLSFLYSFVVALVFSSKELATYTVYTSYVFKGLNYVALLLIGFGILRFAKDAQANGEA